MLYCSLPCEPCLSQPFHAFGSGQINNTKYFLWAFFFFLTTEILLTSRPNYTVPKPSSSGAIFLIVSFILRTLNKRLTKSRLEPICGRLYRKWIAAGQIKRGNYVFFFFAEGMPLSSLGMSDSAGASEDKFRANRRPPECCIAVLGSLRHEQTLQQLKCSSGAWGKRGFSAVERHSSSPVVSGHLFTPCLVLPAQRRLCQLLAVRLRAA